MTAELTVLCWDDPRCTDPLERAAEAYRALPGGRQVRVIRRSLAEFNDEPIEQAAARADLLVLDYPMIPRAAESGVLVSIPLAERYAVSGAVASSFDWDGSSWALPVDAACQVGAWRPDLIASPPRTWSEVIELARRDPSSVAMSLYHSDVICALLSISAAHGDVNEDALRLREEAVQILLDVTSVLDERLFEIAPPRLLDELGRRDDIAYVPLVFGYSRFTAPDSSARFSWTDAPVGTSIGSVLGGAGLAVSADSVDPDGAVDFARWYASPDVQRDLVGLSGGQPAAAAAWSSARVDQAAGGFFSETGSTMRAAVRRPAHPAWPAFSLDAGIALVDAIRSGRSAGQVIGVLRTLAGQHSFPLLLIEGN